MDECFGGSLEHGRLVINDACKSVPLARTLKFSNAPLRVGVSQIVRRYPRGGYHLRNVCMRELNVLYIGTKPPHRSGVLSCAQMPRSFCHMVGAMALL